EADEAGHPTAAAYVGLFAERRSEVAEAEQAYRRADERGDGFGAFRLGMLLSSRGDWSEADAAWRRAEERGREQPVDLVALLHGGQAAEQPAVGSERSVLASPVLVGAITVLALLLAVFLDYTANAGLPFVPTKELKVDIGDGSQLV